MMVRRLSMALILLALLGFGVHSAEAQTLRIGVFDAQRVFNETAEGAKIQARLNALQTEKQDELERVQQELRAMQQNMVATAASVSNDKLRELRLKIDRKTIELESLQKSATREFQLAVEQAQADWQARLEGLVRKYGREKGYTLILPIGVVIYHADTTDITEDLIKIVDGSGADSAS
ncbi:MAG: OmpH family outer membrane protein [Acidobacteriota bacterium]|nr:OmpH family outer membrane protein [Acidobacteriota bacterium]